MKKIALDFDNVLADTMTAWINYYNKQYNSNLRKSDVTLWKFWELESIGMTRENAYKIFDEVWFKWQDLNPLEKNIGLIVEGLRKLAEVHIVTATLGDITEWLKFHEVRYDGFKRTDYSEKPGLKYDIFIDDSPDDALELGMRGKVCLLYDQPWNQPHQTKYLFDDYNTIFRITRLDESLDFIGKMV